MSLSSPSVVDPRLQAPWLRWRGDLRPLLRLPLILMLLGCLAFAVDIPVTHWLPQRQLLNFLDDVLQVFESFGDAVGIILFGLALFLIDVRRRFTVVRVMLASIGSGLVADAIKMLVSRTRPYDWHYNGGVFDTFQGWLPFAGAGTGGQSFPSAHVATSMGMALALGSVYPRGRGLFLMVTGLVALQRIEVGAHFVSDACFGAVVGCLTSLVVFRKQSLGLLFNYIEHSLLKQGDNFVDPTGGSGDLDQTALRLAIVSGERHDAAADHEPPPIVTPFRTAAGISSLSIVIPIFNERDNLLPLYRRLASERTQLPDDLEILFVDDGSADGSEMILRQLAAADPCVKILQLRRNFGQTAAMQAGIEHATGDVIAFLDGDLQNDPADLAGMLDMVREGFDLVQGWRKTRHDAWLSRRLPSWAANCLIGWVTGTAFHDIGCTLKVIRREIALELPLYGEMHRFIPILAHARGARCSEMVTRHHPRMVGQSKYGLGRTFGVLIDLITIKFLLNHLASPMRLFGRLGLLCGAVGMLASLAMIAMKWTWKVDLAGNPLLTVALGASIGGLQFAGLGLLAELGMRTYFESHGRSPYAVQERINFSETSQSLREAA